MSLSAKPLGGWNSARDCSPGHPEGTRSARRNVTQPSSSNSTLSRSYAMAKRPSQTSGSATPRERLQTAGGTCGRDGESLMHCLRLVNCQVYLRTVRNELRPQERAMGKALVFAYGNADLAFDPIKIDRSVLYGFKELEVLDDRGQRCELATLADDGKTVVGRGGVTYAYLAPDGAWCDKSGLKPVDLEGREIQPVASSFSAPVALVEKATLEEYLSHNVRSVYLMQNDGSAVAVPGGTPRGDDLQVPLQLPRRPGGRRRLSARGGRRQRLPGRGQPDQDRVRRPAAGRRPGGGRGRRRGSRYARFRHDLSLLAQGESSWQRSTSPTAPDATPSSP